MPAKLDCTAMVPGVGINSEPVELRLKREEVLGRVLLKLVSVLMLDICTAEEMMEEAGEGMDDIAEMPDPLDRVEELVIELKLVVDGEDKS